MIRTYQLTFSGRFVDLHRRSRRGLGQNVQQGVLPGALKLVATATSSSRRCAEFWRSLGRSRASSTSANRTAAFASSTSASRTRCCLTDFLNVEGVLGATLMDDTGTGERGLLGAAFHPDFNNAANPNGFRKFYTFTSETLCQRDAAFRSPVRDAGL